MLDSTFFCESIVVHRNNAGHLKIFANRLYQGVQIYDITTTPTEFSLVLIQTL